MKSRFEKTFKEQGASFLSQKNVGMLKVVASRYEKYSEFFDGLAREVSTTEVKAELRELAGAAKTVSSNLNDVVNGNAVLEEISSLFDNMDFIRSKVAFYQTSAKKDEVFRKELEKYEKQSSTDLGEIAKVNAQIENKIKGLGEKRRGPLQYLKDVAPGLYETGAGIGGAMTDAFLGPFSDIGKRT